ncbi:expressed unknown protein [Seminavis robusta]|uniref:Uncharacterized protein n=1 Tax=Seminavis robusta TaxID=568900 RepID=A0A9N8ET41_9STRA|nr:expressed unknown protein [Seminavis robusta]|eukprot:Sro1885_g303560.1 n/a (430) ;mRNA; f:13245-14534
MNAAAVDNTDASTASDGSENNNRSKQQMAMVRRIVSRVLMPIRKCRVKRTNVIDQLKQNDEEFSVLKLDGSHTVLNLDRLVDAIECNTTVKNIQIHGGLIANLPLEQQHLLWHALGKLPKLEEIHFKYFLEFPLMLDGLNCLLDRAKGVRKLTVYDSVLYTRNYDDRLITLEQHENLKTVFFSQLRIPEGRVLDPIVQSIVTAPNLSNLTIRIPRKKKNLVTTETLRRLVRDCANLKILELRRIVLRDEHIIQMAKDLEETQNKKCPEGEEPKSKIKEVTVQCDDTLREDCCAALGSLLKNNSTITRLEVWGQKVVEDGFVEVISSLKENKTLKVLHLSHDIGDKGNSALTDLLKQNYVMETLYMRSFGDPTMMAKTDYFLKLNATSLRGLQLDINMNRAKLVEKLEKHNEELNHLYFILRGNPNVFDA